MLTASQDSLSPASPLVWLVLQFGQQSSEMDWVGCREDSKSGADCEPRFPRWPAAVPRGHGLGLGHRLSLVVVLTQIES